MPAAALHYMSTVEDHDGVLAKRCDAGQDKSKNRAGARGCPVKRHQMLRPPATLITSPVMYPPFGPARKQATADTSSSVAMRRIG